MEEELVFLDFKLAVQEQFGRMTGHTLFRMGAEKDALWETYLTSFPEGTNPIFRERTEHDCQCCKQFIRAVGNVVAVIDGRLVSLWDIDLGGHYQVVADAMAALVRSQPIENIFLHTEPHAGTDESYQETEGGEVLTWSHFFVELPPGNVCAGKDIGTKLGEARSTFEVFHRSLTEITPEAVATVQELIAQNSLYRGEEHKRTVDTFAAQQSNFDILTDTAKELYVWTGVHMPNSVTRIRNTSIGTLLVDLSDGMDLEKAVRKFEAMVAPANYKRPTSLITKAMIEKARAKVDELGFGPALGRRYAVPEDVSINNVLFADRDTRPVMKDVFDELAGSVPAALPNLANVDAVTIEDFLADILPNISSLELMLENRVAGNLVSLIAPVHPDAKSMLKWANNFSWAYAGEVADSIKARVKSAGGNVEGDLRCSLAWFNFDDLDLHMVEPNRFHIFFGDKHSHDTGGNLDVDMNAGGRHVRNAVENICYPDRGRMPEGTYRLFVNQYTRRESVDVGFEVEVEFDGVVHTFGYEKGLTQGENVPVATINYTRAGGFKIIESLPSSITSKEVWGLPTQQFHRVSMMMLSPNHWDGHAAGNRHFFFILEGCRQEGQARGFFNEFLTDDLREHRKVFEVLGSKMKTEDSDNQLSGLGFSSTQRNHVLCRIDSGRTLKLTF